MDWLEILYQILEVCVIPLLGILTAFLVKWLRAKELEVLDKIDSETADKYIAMLFDTITACVSTTTETYVKALKAEGKFDAEAQKIAFNKTYEAIIATLSEEAKGYLTSIYGDLTTYLTVKIEAEIKAQK